jgi:hypothetical protein
MLHVSISMDRITNILSDLDSSRSFVQVSSVLMAGTGAITFFTLLHLAAPYGRYNKDALSMGSWIPKIPARLAWVIMELPNLWVTVLVVLLNFSRLHLGDGASNADAVGDAEASPSATVECCMASVVNRVLLGAFLAHYVHRAVVFPLLMSPDSAPMPAHVMFLALLFCVWNGLNQSIYLTRVYCYE